MLRTVLLLLATVCAFGLGRISKTADAQIIKVPGPVQIVMPTANRGAELSPGYRWLNLDASVPIFQVDSEAQLKGLIGYDGDGFLMGAYTHEPQEGIYILGTWSIEAEVAIHEYTHMLEANLPDQAWRIRRVFHKLCSPKFQIDSSDLEPELPVPTP